MAGNLTRLQSTLILSSGFVFAFLGVGAAILSLMVRPLFSTRWVELFAIGALVALLAIGMIWSTYLPR